MPDSDQATGLPKCLASPANAALAADLRTLLNSPVCLQDLLAEELEQASRLSGCDTAALYLFDDDPERARLKLAAQRGLDLGEQQSFAALTRALDLAMQAAVTGEPVVCQDCPWPGPSAGPGQGACAAVPLTVSNWTLGALLVMSDGPLEFGPARLEALAALGRRLASAVAAQAMAQQVADERDSYERIATNVRDCIWTCYFDPFRITLVTDGIVELSGYTRQEIMNRPTLMQEMVHPDDRPAVQQQREAILAGELTDVHHRVRLLHKSGELRWMHTRGRAVRDEHGWRLDAITTDITDHVRLEEKVRRADRLSAVGILAGGIAHEYNNLHFAILGTLDLMLMREDLDDAVRTHVHRVREAAERASDITNKLVSFARSGSGGREIMDVSELIEATLGMVKREFSTRGIDVQIRQSPLPLRVQGNRAELGQVLINLVLNAQQAMEGSTEKHLTIDTGGREGRVFVSIADTGHGIGSENLPRL
ncbi:MAG: PAS domain-containing protein, partial [Armatimonadota bacterium]